MAGGRQVVVLIDLPSRGWSFGRVRLCVLIHGTRAAIPMDNADVQAAVLVLAVSGGREVASHSSKGM